MPPNFEWWKSDYVSRSYGSISWGGVKFHFRKIMGIRQTQSIFSTIYSDSNMFIPNNNKTSHPTPKKLNESVHIQLTVMLHCLYARLPQYYQMANLTNVAKMEFDPTPTYRPITPRYLIRFLSFKIWWHDNMLTYAQTKYWIHPITSY